MADLTPVLKADRNGKLVTRHMKPVQATSQARTILPPTVAKRESLEDLRTTLTEALQIGINDTNQTLDRYQTEALITLAQKHYMSAAGVELIDGMSRIKGEAFDECIGLLDRNFELADSIMRSLEYRSIAYQSQVPLLITGMNLHEFEMTPAQEQLLTEAVCRIWVSDALDDHKYVDKTFPSRDVGAGQRCIGKTAIREDLAQYIVQDPDQLSTIITMVTERKISDPEEIESMISSAPATSLIDGVL